jgi:hypothetical protein
MMGADLLLLFQGRQFNAQIPAKAYEYIRCGRPVMGLVDGQGQSAAFLASFEATWMADIGTQGQIEQALLKWMNATSDSQSLQSNLHNNMINIQSYSRASQAARLASLLNELPARH